MFDLYAAKKRLDELLGQTRGQKLKLMYGDDVEHLKKFNKDLWKEAINNQISISDEELWYAKDDDPMKKYLPLFEGWSGIIDGEMSWQFVEESDFPIQFLIIEDNGKRIVMSVMFGQGSVCDIMPENEFKNWMERCENKYQYDSSKVISVDKIEKVVKENIERMEKDFQDDNI